MKPRVLRATNKLLHVIQGSGCKVRTGRPSRKAVAQYLPEEPAILLSRKTTDGWGRPYWLDHLLVLAHEYGHHISYSTGYGNPWGSTAGHLDEEIRAWDYAYHVLMRIIRSPDVLAAFEVRRAYTLAINLEDYCQNRKRKARLPV